MLQYAIGVGAALALGSIGLQAQVSAPCASPRFDVAVNFDTGLFASGVAIGDFNRDGLADMAVTNQNSANVSVLPGDGKGGFGGKTDFAVGGPPQRIATADLDGDGTLDLVLPLQAADAVAVLWGDGKGGFSAPAMFAVSGGPFMPVVADFNGDGHLDVAVTTRTEGSRRVAVLLGTGIRSFRTASFYGLFQNAPAALGVGDFNRDGLLDLAVGGGTNAPAGSNNLSIFLADGKDGFGTPSVYTVGPDPQSMSVADLNGDGLLDIAISNSLPRGTNSTVSVLFGDGKGTFRERLPLEIGVTGRGTGVADFNGDGSPDLVIANNDSNTVSVLLGDGRGHFAARADFKVGTGPRKLTVGDLNGDGRADIVVPNTGSNNVSVLINSCRP